MASEILLGGANSQAECYHSRAHNLSAFVNENHLLHKIGYFQHTAAASLLLDRGSSKLNTSNAYISQKLS